MDIKVEKKVIVDSEKNEKEFALFNPSVLDLQETDAADFFNQIDENGIELIAWPIDIAKVLTDEDEVYNEEYLAVLRKLFIESENHKAKVLLKPVYENISAEIVTQVMKHTARRLKKMSTIIGCGFYNDHEFSEEKNLQFFMNELLEKHEHYKFYFI